MVSSLWVGDELPLLARLCIQSFLDHGISFRLFTYQSYDHIPEGTILCDARSILPEEMVFIHHTGSYAPFADWFRYTLLEQEGGFWTDLDVACLSGDLPASMPYFSLQERGLAAIGVLGFPKAHPVMAAMRKIAEDPASPMPWDSAEEAACKKMLMDTSPDKVGRRRNTPWGTTGPEGFTHVLKQLGFLDHAVPSSHLYPLHYTIWRHAYDGMLNLKSPELSNAWAIHLWGEMLRKEPDALENVARHSIAGQLLDKHLPPRITDRTPRCRKKVNILVGICSCLSSGERRKAVRETWLSRQTPGIECLFFLGRRSPLPDEPDVITLWVNDSYDYLPEKGLAFYRYALEHYDFDWLFKCDDDTYVALNRLESLCDHRYGLIGDMSLETRGFPSGGAGYLLSRDTLEQIIAEGERIPSTGPEDIIFGRAARELGVPVLASPRLLMDCSHPPSLNNHQVTAHWCSPHKLRMIDSLFAEGPASIYHGTHRHWRDELCFYKNGTFMRRHSGDMGSFILHPGHGITLRWDDWAPETLTCQGTGYAMEGFALLPVPGQPGLEDVLMHPDSRIRNTAWSRKLHLGCGNNYLEGWLNLDLPNGDITKPLPWPNESIEALFLEHVIEHVPADAAFRFFEEALRVLEPGGVLRLAFPDLLKIARDATPEYLSFLQNRQWGDGTAASAVRNIIANHEHHAIWTEETMRIALKAVGFEVKTYSTGESDLSQLQELERHQTQIGELFNAMETTCIEAHKKRK